jgi:hypothetical protein
MGTDRQFKTSGIVRAGEIKHPLGRRGAQQRPASEGDFTMRFPSVLKALAVLLPMGLGIAAPAEAAPPAKSLLTPEG